MTTNADIGYGVSLQFIPVGGANIFAYELLSVDGPDMSKDAPEATHSGSPAVTSAQGTAASVGYKEFIDGMIDAGTVSCEVNFDPNQEPLITQAKGSLVITAPIATGDTSGATFTVDAVVTKYSPKYPVDGKMTAGVTFKLSGKPTWAAGA